MTPKRQNLADLAQEYAHSGFGFFAAVFASKGCPFGNIFVTLPPSCAASFKLCQGFLR